MDYRLHILGTIELHVDGVHVQLRDSARARGVLGALAVVNREAVSAEELLRRLWGYDAEWPRNPNNTLQQYVSRARRVLKDSGVPVEIAWKHGKYLLDIDPTAVDLHIFRQLAADGELAVQQGDLARAHDLLTQAMQLWRGDPLADLRSEWAEGEREDLIGDDLVNANAVLIRCELELGHHARALNRVNRLLKRHELDEKLTGLRYQALHRLGRHNEISDLYRGFRHRLLEAFGNEPTTALDQLVTSLIQAPFTAPPPRPVRVVPRQLLPDVRGFTGRTHQLAQLDEVLAGSGTALRFAVVDGPGGIGKTTLVTHWAHRVTEHFPDGQIYVDLGGFGPDDPLPPATAITSVLDALHGLDDRRVSTLADRSARLRTLTTGLRLLIVLDNAHSAEQVRPLLPNSPDCLVVAVSRNRLAELDHRESPYRVTVPGLSRQESRDLLVSMIGRDRADREAIGVDQLTDACGGVPLSLRVAGGAALTDPHTPLADLMDQLGEDDSPIQLAFSSSYLALDEQCRRTFALLGFFPGRLIGRAPAAALLDVPEPAVERLLTPLYQANLLDRDANRRYRMHDQVRVYAARRAVADLPAADQARTVHRVLDWYLHTAYHADLRMSAHRHGVPVPPAATEVTALSFESDRQARQWFLSERENVVDAVRLAAEHGFHDHAWRLAATVRDSLEHHDLHTDSLTMHRVALASARATGDVTAEADTLNNLGKVHYRLGDHGSAFDCYKDALALFEQVGDVRGRADCWHNLGSVAVALENYSPAQRHYRQALRLRRSIGHRNGIAHTLHRLGRVCRNLDDYDQALACYQEALSIREDIGHVDGQGTTLAELGAMQLERGDPTAAVASCERALRLHTGTLNRRHAVRALLTLANAHHELGQHTAAIEYAKRAADLNQLTGDFGELDWTVTLDDPTTSDLRHKLAALDLGPE